MGKRERKRQLGMLDVDGRTILHYNFKLELDNIELIRLAHGRNN